MKLLILILLPFFATAQYQPGDTLLIKRQTCECGWAGFAPDTAYVIKGGVLYDFTNEGNPPTKKPIREALRSWAGKCSKIWDVKYFIKK